MVFMLTRLLYIFNPSFFFFIKGKFARKALFFCFALFIQRHLHLPILIWLSTRFFLNILKQILKLIGLDRHLLALAALPLLPPRQPLQLAIYFLEFGFGVEEVEGQHGVVVEGGGGSGGEWMGVISLIIWASGESSLEGWVYELVICLNGRVVQIIILGIDNDF